jgi:hypothetical protein
MSKGRIRAQVNDAAKLLKNIDLLEEHLEWVKYPDDLPSRSRKLAYHDEYALYSAGSLYDMRLVDGALFQFRDDLPGDDISYSYLQAPYDVPTYDEFVRQQLDMDVAEVGDELREDYQLAIDTARLREAVIPIRYDYSPNLYEVGVHPASHLHIARGNEMRLSARRLMMPLSFVLFIVRQLYPDHWRRFLRREEAGTICRMVRDEIEHVHERYYSTQDRLELILD